MTHSTIFLLAALSLLSGVAQASSDDSYDTLQLPNDRRATLAEKLLRKLLPADKLRELEEFREQQLLREATLPPSQITTRSKRSIHSRKEDLATSANTWAATVYGRPHGTGAWIPALLQMSVSTGGVENTFLNFFAAVSSLIKILVATDSSWSPPHF